MYDTSNIKGEKDKLMKEGKINLDHYIVQSEGNIVSDMDGEKVMLSIKNGKYYNLGKIGGTFGTTSLLLFRLEN